jgi:hypothetical protein
MIKISINELQKLLVQYQVDFRIFGDSKIYFHSKKDEWVADVSHNKIVLKHIEGNRPHSRGFSHELGRCT